MDLMSPLQCAADNEIKYEKDEIDLEEIPRAEFYHLSLKRENEDLADIKQEHKHHEAIKKEDHRLLEVTKSRLPSGIKKESAEPEGKGPPHWRLSAPSAQDTEVKDEVRRRSVIERDYFKRQQEFRLEKRRKLQEDLIISVESDDDSSEADSRSDFDDDSQDGSRGNSRPYLKRKASDICESPLESKKARPSWDHGRGVKKSESPWKGTTSNYGLDIPPISSFAHVSKTAEISQKAIARQKKFIEKKLWQIEADLPSGPDFDKAVTELEELKAGLRVFGDGMIWARDDGWKPKAMKTPLKNYQVPATAWMIRREKGVKGPHGGILADTMGIGKTVESLACIAGNPPSSEDIRQFCRATLIVVPNRAIAKQWESEIQKHCAGAIGKSVILYSSQRGLDIKDYASYWVVLTTFTEVGKRHISSGELRELREQHGNDERAYKADVKRRLGPLFHNAWYRIVLDEAHAIKGLGGRNSRACCDLNAKYYWAVSATPITNCIEELVPYLRFIGMDIARDLDKFREFYVTGNGAKDRLQELVKKIMYRRNSKETFLGKKILDIPESHSEDIVVELSREEQIIIESIEEFFNEEIQEIEEREEEDDENLESEKKVVRRGRLIRLRQGVSHPYNLENFLREKLECRHVGTMRRALQTEGNTKNLADTLETHPYFKGSIDAFKPELSRLRRVHGPIFGGGLDLGDILARTENEITVRGFKCRICCQAPPRSPLRNLDCEHIYCGDCLLRELLTAQRSTLGDDNEKCRWPGCDAIFGYDRKLNPVLKTLQCLQSDIQAGRMDTSKRAKYVDKDPSKDTNDSYPHLKSNRNGLFEAGFHPQDTIPTPPSSKLTATMAVILRWAEESPSDKILVFTQFIPTAKVLGKMLRSAEIPFLYYMGGIRTRERERNLKDFNTREEIKVLIVTLKCGGESLNLQVANRMILIDPWWNEPVENQAFGRVVRQGQTKTSHLVRIITNSEIDKMIIDLQKDKSAEIDGVLGDNRTEDEENRKEAAEVDVVGNILESACR